MRNTDPEKMSLSSADENLGIAPVLRAVDLVRLMITTDFLEENGKRPEPDELPTIYVVSFTYILGGWKAMISTSEANGHYYEVTYNAARRETYLDRYSKDYNEVIPDSEHKVTVEVQSKPSINFVPGPPPAEAAMRVANIEAARRQQIRLY